MFMRTASASTPLSARAIQQISARWEKPRSTRTSSRLRPVRTCSTARPPSQIPTASRCTSIVEVAISWVSSPAACPVIAAAKATTEERTATARARPTEVPSTATVVVAAAASSPHRSQTPSSVARKTPRSEPKRGEPTGCPVAIA